LDGDREIAFTQPQRDIDQANQHGDLHQRPDNGGKCLPRIDPENRHGHGNGQFKVVGGGGKRQRRRLLISGIGFILRFRSGNYSKLSIDVFHHLLYKIY
jgi:hypothetical protein